MTTLTFILRSLRFHARSHLGALLGAAVGTAVLLGALLVGDSVRGSLRDMALSRLGATHYALASNDRYFRSQLSDQLAQATSAKVVPALQLAGTAAAQEGSARANAVQVLGVDQRFWQFAPGPISFPQPGADEVILNHALAEQLNAKLGETVLLRVDKPSKLSREAAIAPQEDFALALRVSVRGIASDQEMGRFGLRASQVAPFNAFLDLAWLAERVQLAGRANLLLTSGGPQISLAALTRALQQQWRLADAELEWRPLQEAAGFELKTPRVFLDVPVADAAKAAAPGARGVLTYFVNELRVGARAAPYSMVAATEVPIGAPDLKEDQVVVNEWLADDLAAKPGDKLSMAYFVIGSGQRLEVRTNQFTIRAVVSMTGAAADRTLMPDFPGLEKAESTRDWDSSLPIELDRIRPKDEEYWKQYRGTPKAFLTLPAGQQMWTNRFGTLTSVRYPSGAVQEAVDQTILAALSPSSLGMTFEPVREQALAASAQAQDFGQLFLGFSFFLIIAALLLMAMLYQFSVERRATEIGTLLAVGFTPRLVRRLLIGEGVALSLVGAAIGIPGGIAYAHGMLYGLSTLWRSAVGTSGLSYHASGLTLLTGAVSGTVVASMTVWLASRRQARQPARELLAQGAETERSNDRKSSRGIWIGWLTSALAMIVIGWAGLQDLTGNPGVFFLAGTLLLASGLAFAAAGLSALNFAESTARPTLGSMARRNVSRRRRRSLATISLLACGSFIVAAIGAFKLESTEGVRKRASGTGGFALVGEASFRVVHDLNTEAGREFFGLSESDLAGVRVVSLRVRAGEDASCLNLNRAQKPRLLGVRPQLLAERGAFTFAKVLGGAGEENPWLLLNGREPDGSVPAIGDAASIQWALGKKVGDTLTYLDDRGHEFKIRLVAAVANSILQGNLLIGETAFLERFPTESGYGMFLVDVQPHQPAQIQVVAERLSRALQDYGAQFMPATRRLAAFNAVQNTYLNTFQVLGGLGLLLGSVGLGVVVLRNVLERRSELALLLAVGFSPGTLRRLVVTEHGLLLFLGLVIGVVAAMVAVLPSLLTPGAGLPLKSLALTLGAVLLSGFVWTWAATQIALRGQLLDALRSE